MTTSTAPATAPTERAGTSQPRPRRRPTPRRRTQKAGFYVLLVVIAVAFIGPLLILLSTSLKSPSQDLYGYPPDLIPRPPTLQYFIEAWTTIPFARFLLNSLIYVLITVPLYLAISALTAWPLARISFRGQRLGFLLFLAPMFLPGELMLVPRFLVFSELNLTDSYTSIILPALLSPLGIFMLRQTFAQIPDEIIEAARVDGAGEFRIFARLAIPIAGPTLAVLAIFGFISVWNSFIWPMVALTTQSKYPLALGLAYLTGVSGTDVRGLAAGTVLSIIPVVAIFLLLQRRIFSNMGGAVKG